MKHILFVTQNLTLGGVQNIVTSLANSLVSQYRCTILLFEDNKEIFYTLDPKIEIKQVALKQVDISQKNAGEEILAYRFEMLQKMVDIIKPDLIFSHEDYYNILTLQIQSDAKKVPTSHISLTNFYTKQSKIHLLDATYYTEKIKELYHKADKLICVSKNIYNEIKQLNPNVNAQIIYNGIEHKEVQTPELLAYDYILNIGRANPQKGQKDLLKAFAKIVHLIEEKLVIIGGGTLLKELQELCHSLDIDKRVVFLGDIKDPLPYIKQAKFCINASHQEGFSLAVLEMMHYGTLLSSKYQGYDEILQDYDNLFEVSHEEEIGKKIVLFANNPEKTTSLKQKQHKDTLPFSKNAMVRHYEDLLKSLV